MQVRKLIQVWEGGTGLCGQLCAEFGYDIRVCNQVVVGYSNRFCSGFSTWFFLVSPYDFLSLSAGYAADLP